MSEFRLSEALKTIYSLVWDDFCSWYLEWVKPGFEQPVDRVMYERTLHFFEELMALIHPFMPFISEEIYHLLRTQSVDLVVRNESAYTTANQAVLQRGALLKQVISTLRDTRNKNQLKPKDSIKLFIETQQPDNYQSILPVLAKQINAELVVFTPEAQPKTIVVAIEQDKFYIESKQEVDSAAMRAQLEKDLEYQQNFLASVLKKLSNERFVQNARPEVIDLERKKQSDAEARIRTIEESLRNLIS